MEPLDIFSNISISDAQIIAFFFWAFSLLFSLFYFIYAVIIVRQANTLNRTLRGHASGSIFLISSIQMPVAIALFIFAILGFLSVWVV